MSEKLSNLLDKHVAASDVNDFLRQCGDDGSLIEKWQRYHLASAMIRNEINETDVKYDVSQKVMQSLQSQPFDSQNQSEDDPKVVPITPAVENRPLPPRSISSLAASRPWFSVAAAAGVLLGLYFMFQQPLLDTPSQQVVDDGPVTMATSLPVHDWQASSREIEDTLNSLLVEHSEFTSVTGMNGLGSYSKFIAYQN